MLKKISIFLLFCPMLISQVPYTPQSYPIPVATKNGDYSSNFFPTLPYPKWKVVDKTPLNCRWKKGLSQQSFFDLTAQYSLKYPDSNRPQTAFDFVRWKPIKQFKPGNIISIYGGPGGMTATWFDKRNKPWLMVFRTGAKFDFDVCLVRANKRFIIPFMPEGKAITF